MEEDKLLQKIKSKFIYVNSGYEKYLDYTMIKMLSNNVVVYMNKCDKMDCDEYIYNLFNSLCKVEKNVSFSEFERYIYDYVISNDNNKFKDILDYYKEKEIEEYHFFRPIGGLKFENTDYYIFNNIVFIKKDYIYNYLKNFSSNKSLITSSNQFKEIIEIKEEVIYIDITCSAKDSSCAKEYADQKLQIIDKYFRFLLGTNNSEFHIGIYNLNYHSLYDSYFYNNNTFGIYNESNKRAVNIDEDIYFLFESDFAKNLWDLLVERDNLNSFEKRIKQAIVWVAEATHQNDDSIAFVQCFFAVESILMEQDGFINKSIAAQISEYVAFILSKDKNERINLEKEIKELYKIRSSIAHGKNKIGIKSDLSKLIKLTRKIICLFLIDNKLSTISNINELREYITNLKYQ